MDSMQNENSNTLSSRRRNGNKSRRSWTDREEEVLIACMKELVASGKKGDNGFKVGYLQILEQNMAKIFSGTDLRGMPHINSKLHIWKKNYGSLATMLSRSGVGWNETTKMIEATDEGWESIAKNDTNARLMRFKSWSFYNDWVEIFGKDRATGEQAEDVIDAVNEMVNSYNRPDKEFIDEFNILPDDADEDTEVNYVSQSARSGAESKSTGKKRKRTDGNEGMYELLGSFCRSAEASLGDIAKKIGYEYDLSNARKKVYDVVGKIPGISAREQLAVSKLLVKNTEYLELFSGLSPAAKLEFVRDLLHGDM